MNIAQPNRKKHCYTQHLNALPTTVFPLLCPVMETKWVPGWMPELVVTNTGVCEPDCAFVTLPEFPSEPENAIWLVTKYDPGNFALTMYKVVPRHTISKLEILLSDESGGSTAAQISYEITSIGEAGDQFLEEFTEVWYEAFMADWEKAMNHYLETGSMIA